MKSKISLIKNKLGNILKDKEVIDIILFGSTIKGKALPKDIDIAIITNSPEKIKRIEGFHTSILKPDDFILNSPSLVTTLLKEGFSLKNNKFLSELYNFSAKVLFTYDISNQKPSKKVKIVTILRGKNNEKGLVEQNKGEWLANQVFIVSVENSNIFEKFFLNFSVKFKKYNILIH